MSLCLRSPNARIASEFWFSAGEPTTKPTRLPLSCLISVTPVSLATPSEAGVAIDRGQHELQGLRTPFLGAEFEHAFLREIGAGAHRRHDRALGAQRRQPRHVVAGGQHADVGAVFVLHHLADGDGDVEAGGAGVVGGEGHGRRQLDVFGQRRGDASNEMLAKSDRRERHQPTDHVFPPDCFAMRNFFVGRIMSSQHCDGNVRSALVTAAVADRLSRTLCRASKVMTRRGLRFDDRDHLSLGNDVVDV